MIKCINGWTKKRMLEVLESRPFEEAAMTRDGVFCSYLNDKGNKCAVGMFIPDGHPGSQESGPVHELLYIYPDLIPLMPLSLESLTHLQCVHDDPHHRKDAKSHMIQWVDSYVQKEV